MKDNKLSQRSTKNLVDFSWTEEQLKLKKAVIEFESERDLCDTIGGSLCSGTPHNQRMIIARCLGL